VGAHRALGREADADGPDDRGLHARPHVRDARHRPQHRPRARRRARPRAGRRARPRRRALHPRSPARQPLARRDRPAARGGDRALRAPAARAVRPRLVRRCLHRSGGAAHGPAAGGAPHGRAHGAQAHVLLAHEGGARARTAADRSAGSVARRRPLVRRPRVRARGRGRAGGGAVSLVGLSSRVTRKSRSNFYYAFLALPRSTYGTCEDLAPYCYRVASAVGLGCIEIFGYTDPRAREYAVSLGMALQLTNIIRDVGADARSGRIYVPQQDLRASGVSAEDLKVGRYGDAFVRLMAAQAARAREHYARAWPAVPAADARSLVPAPGSCCCACAAGGSAARTSPSSPIPARASPPCSVTRWSATWSRRARACAASRSATGWWRHTTSRAASATTAGAAASPCAARSRSRTSIPAVSPSSSGYRRPTSGTPPSGCPTTSPTRRRRSSSRSRAACARWSVRACSPATPRWWSGS